MIKILIADDHSIFRQSLISFLKQTPGIKIAGEAYDGNSCIKTALRVKPDVILMDIDMPGINGIETTKEILKNIPVKSKSRKPLIIMLSMYFDKSHVFESIKAGAMGYVVKDCTKDELLKIIKSVNDGSFTLHHSLAANFIDSVKTLPYEINRNLTAREIELVECVSRGLSNKQIASRLFISERTVKNHLNLIFKKLGVSNRAQVVNEAIKKGIISSI